MFRLVSLLVAAAALVAAQDGTLRWMPVESPRIDVAGLPWFHENDGEFWRLPARSRDKFPKEVWNLSLSPTGGRIRFRTDSPTVALRLEWPHRLCCKYTGAEVCRGRRCDTGSSTTRQRQRWCG